MAGLTPNTVWNVGSATLTTVVSRIAMMAPRTTTPEIFSTSLSSLSECGGGAGTEMPAEPAGALVDMNAPVEKAADAGCTDAVRRPAR